MDCFKNFSPLKTGKIIETKSFMKKILIILGTRPEAIKLLPIIKEFEKHKDKVEIKVISTGQHKEMLAQVFDMFSLKPDIDFGLMTKNQSLSKLTCLLLDKINETLITEKPDWVIAQGDTTSVLATSIACFYNKVKFAHLEAGLRTNNIYSPFPEEFNRKICSIVADINFAPTNYCKELLIKEGIDENKIIVTGNSVIDSVLYISQKYHSNDFENEKRKIILVTAHRRENFASMQEMFLALKQIATNHKDILIIYPVHLNPNVRDKAHNILKNIMNIRLIEPLNYKDFINLMKISSLILTDSGGIQEEAPSFGVPVLIMRENTERPEGVKSGVSELVGVKKQTIIDGFEKHYNYGLKKHSKENPYGDGKTAERVVGFFVRD